MFIRKKTEEKIQKDINAVKKDMEIGIVRNDLYGTLGLQNYPKYLNKTRKLEKQRGIFEKNGTLVLRICKNKNNLINASKSTNTTAANTIIEFGNYREYLHLHKKFEQGKINDLKIFIQYDNGGYELIIPHSDKTHMLQYLIDGIPLIKFDCQSFIHKVKGMKMSEHGANFSILKDKWILSNKQPNELKPGDCVCIFYNLLNNGSSFNSNGIQHFAYYIGNGLFISQFGNGGSLFVSNLQEMHNFYGTKEFVSMTPDISHEATNI